MCCVMLCSSLDPPSVFSDTIYITFHQDLMNRNEFIQKSGENVAAKYTFPVNLSIIDLFFECFIDMKQNATVLVFL